MGSDTGSGLLRTPPPRLRERAPSRRYRQWGARPPLGFNSVVVAFVPKGEKEVDSIEVTREAMSTRPCSLKTSVSKLVAAVANRSVAALAKATVHPTL